MIWEARGDLLLRLLPLYLVLTLGFETLFAHVQDGLVGGLLQADGPRLRNFSVIFLGWLAYWAAMLFCAMIWHRILLPVARPLVTGRALALYLRAALKLAFVLFVAVLLPGWILHETAIEHLFVSPTPLWLSVMTNGILPALGAWIWFRCGAILPAAANDTPGVTLSAAWADSRPHVAPLAGLILPYLAVLNLPDLPLVADQTLWTLLVALGLAALTRIHLYQATPETI